jgi:uncharacterized membrane protein
MLSKTRLEALSDGLFAIVLTLLVIEIRVPEVHGPLTDPQLWHELLLLQPLFVGYVVSFAVLAMFWLSHNFFYSHFVKDINRQLLLLNMGYLALVSLIPFSAHLIGAFPLSQLAVSLYGFNVLCIGLLNIAILQYALSSNEIDTTHINKRILHQAKIRSIVTPLCTVIGLGLAFVSIPAALAFFALPILFNIIPGTLNGLERIFGFELGK